MDEEVSGYDRNSQDISVDAFTTESALRIRLDTSLLKMQIQNFLEGKAEYIERGSSGNLISKVRDVGKPMANKIGIQRIMAFIEFFVNPHVFQGNLGRNDYEELMTMARQELASDLLENMYLYGIEENELNLLTDSIMNLIIFTSSRAIENGERKSFVGTIMHSENAMQSYANKQNSSLWQKLKIMK